MSKKNKGTKNSQEMNDNVNTKGAQSNRIDDNAGKKQGGVQSKNDKGCR